MTTRLTRKQIAFLTVIAAGNKDGSDVVIEEILDRLPYETTKESLQFSIRALVKKGLVQKLPNVLRDGRLHRPIGLTELGTQLMKSPARTSKKIIGDVVMEGFDLDTQEVLSLLLEERKAASGEVKTPLEVLGEV